MSRTVDLSYYWGDETFHECIKDLPYTGNIPAMVSDHKDKDAAVAYCIVVIDGAYYNHVEII